MYTKWKTIFTCFAGPFHDGSPYFQKFEIRVGRNIFERNSEKMYFLFFAEFDCGRKEIWHWTGEIIGGKIQGDSTNEVYQYSPDHLGQITSMRYVEWQVVNPTWTKMHQQLKICHLFLQAGDQFNLYVVAHDGLYFLHHHSRQFASTQQHFQTICLNYILRNVSVF